MLLVLWIKNEMTQWLNFTEQCHFAEWVRVQAFTGTYGVYIYGRIADNIPSPDEVVTLLKAVKIKNVRIYDADHSVLQAFSGTGLDLVIGLPNGFVKEMSANSDHALTWVKQIVQAFLPETHIQGNAIYWERRKFKDEQTPCTFKP